MCYALKDSSLDLIYTDYLDLLFKDSDKGFISLFKKNKSSVYQRHYKKELLNEAIEEYLSNDWNLDLYMSLNTFITPKRTLESLRYLNALFIDIDCYKMNMSKESVLYFIENDLYGTDIPIPTFIIDSGRGLYLVWLIDRVPSKAYPLWKALEHKFYNALKEFGADPKALDPTRVLRVPGSINTKSKTVVSILDEIDYIYDLREIQKEFLPELKPKEKKKGRLKKINYIYRERSLYYARIQDITKLCELREYDLRGHREVILFLYRYYLCSFTEDVQKALEDVLELNSMFIYPLKENEVIRATRSAEKCYLDKNKEYKYKNDTLIEILEITEDEEIQMRTIISNREYKRRKRVRDTEYQKNRYLEKLKLDGKVTEKEKLSQRRAKIKDLLAEGLKQKDICLRLNISKDTYIRDRKYLKEQGLM